MVWIYTMAGRSYSPVFRAAPLRLFNLWHHLKDFGVQYKLVGLHHAVSEDSSFFLRKVALVGTFNSKDYLVIFKIKCLLFHLPKYFQRCYM